jgi:signal transduction histidine kinase
MGAIHQEIAGLEPGAHICLPFVSADDHESTVAAFVRGGLRRGERCLYIGSAAAREGIARRLNEEGMPVGRALEDRALILLDLSDVYGRGRPFDPVHQAKVLEALIDAARSDGFNGFRGVEEAPEGLHDSIDPLALLQYEAAASEVLHAKQALALCPYDRRRTPPGTMVGILRSHPLTLLGGRLCVNPLCDPPAYLRGQVGEAQKLDWMINQILSSEQSRRYDQAVNDALLREATSLAAKVQRIKGEAEDLQRAVEARDLLWGAVARRLREPVDRLGDKMSVLLGDERLRVARAVLEGSHEDLEELRELAGRIDGIAAFAAMHGSLRPERMDLVETTRHALTAFKADPAHQRVEVELAAPPAVVGNWDRRRVAEMIGSLLTAACDHGWGTPLALRVEELGELARLTLRFHALELDPIAGAPGLGGGGGHAPLSSGYDRLGMELWTTRELVRLMGGTFGVSSFADAHVAFTVELPRDTERPSASQSELTAPLTRS